MIRIKPNTIFAGRRSVAGVYLFSPPSTSFAEVQLPDLLLFPTVLISGTKLIDTCSSVFLDGAASSDYGFRGTFEWTLEGTSPASSPTHETAVQDVLTEYDDSSFTFFAEFRMFRPACNSFNQMI